MEAAATDTRVSAASGDTAGAGTGRPSAYGFSTRFLLRFLATAAVWGRRNLGRDAWRETGAWRPRPRVFGLERIPERGGFILVMNHYERPGLRVWFSTFLASAAVWTRRRQDPAIRWLATDRLYRFRLAGLVLPDALVRWMLRLIARVYRLVPVHREEAEFRVPALRDTYHDLRGRRGRPPVPIGVTPEAATGRGPELGPAWPTSGMALAWLSRGEVPLVPVAVCEDDAGRMTARFGEPFVLEWPGLRRARAAQEELTARVMRSVAALLPRELRGVYAEATDAP